MYGCIYILFYFFLKRTHKLLMLTLSPDVEDRCSYLSDCLTSPDL